MGLQKIGLGGVLSFATRAAEQNMGRLTRKFGFLRGATRQTTADTGRMSGAYKDASGVMRSANGQFAIGNKTARGFSASLGGVKRNLSRLGDTAGVALSSVGTGLATMGAMMTGVTVGVGKLVSNYSDFNKQMSAVRSVAGDISENEFQALRDQAIALGSATSFTATEAAQGLENLSRAGFSTAEAIGASRAVLNLAAADAIGLAEAAGIASNVIRGLGLSAETDSQRVADVFAQASASANTDVTALGESFKMSAATMSLFGIELEQGTAILSKLADAGLKGSMGGTAFSNMMAKLVKPTKTAAAFMSEMNIGITETDGTMRKVSSIVKDLTAAMSTIPDEGDRVAMAVELMGQRGVKAFNGLSQATKNNGLEELEAELKSASGAAQRMADQRLANLSGQITILKSAAEGFTIRLFDMFKGLDGAVLRPVVNAMIALNEAWDDVKGAMSDGLMDERKAELERKHGSTMIAIVLGIRDGVETLRSAFTSISTKLQEWSRAAEGAMGPDVIRRVTKLAVVVLGLGAVFGPVIAAVGLLALGVSMLMPVFGAVGAVMSAAFWPVLIVAAALGAAFLVMRQEGETLSGFMSRMWGGVKTAALDAWENGIKPLWSGIKQGWIEIWPVIKATGEEAIDSIKNLLSSLSDIWNRITGDVGSSTTDWESVGKTAVIWLGEIISGLIRVGTWLVDTATIITDALMPVIVAIAGAVTWLWSNVIEPFLAGLLAGWTEVWPTLRLVAFEVFDAIKGLIVSMMQIWTDMTGGVSGSTVDWYEVGRVAVQVISWIIIAGLKLVKWSIYIIRFVIEVVGAAVQLVVGFFSAVWEFMKRSVHVVIQFFGGLVDAFLMLADGDVLGAFKTAGLAILNFLLSPLRLVVGAIADLVSGLLGLSAVKKLLPESQLAGMQQFTDSMRKFADKGITLGEAPTSSGKKFVAPTIDDTDMGPEFLDLGPAGGAGFGASQLSQIQNQKIEFEAQESARKEADAAKGAEQMGDKAAEAVKAGLEDATLETTIDSCTNIDGKEVSRSTSKHAQRLGDRLGATTPPFARRVAADQGIIPSQ